MALQTLSLDSDAYIDYTLNEDQQGLIQNNRNINNIRLKHIKSITVDNFKSFAGKHYVGPFTEFTAVIGPNGGGKSNVLDAIAFTLGLTVRDLRCGSPEELIYSRQQYYEATARKLQQEPEEAATTVEILFSSNSPELVRVRRTLSLNGHLNSYVNDVHLSEDEFGSFLLQSKIHVATRNFLLLQGEADNLATIPPTEMTDMFEKLSGSILYKKECQQLEKRMDSIKSNITNLSYSKALLRTEQKKLKELSQTSAQYKSINLEIEQIKIKIKLLNFHIIDEEINETKYKMNQIEYVSTNQIDDRHQVIVDLQRSDIQAKQLQRQISSVQQEAKLKETNLKDIDNQLNGAEQNKKFDNQSAISYQDNIEQLEKDLNNQREMVEEVKLDLLKKKQELEDMIKQNQEMNIPEKYRAEFLSLQQEFKNEHFLMESQHKKLQQQEQLLSELCQQSETAWRQAQTQYNLINSQKQVEQGEYDQLAQQGQLYQERLEQLVDVLKTLDGQHKQQQEELNKVLSLRSEKQKIIHINEITMTEHIDEEESKRVVQQLRATLPKFMGELSGLMNPVSLQWSDALKLAFGQKLLCALVVQDTQSSINVNMILKTMGVVKDIIILEKTKHVDQNQQLDTRKSLEILVENYRKEGKGKQQRNGKAILAIDALEYDKVVEHVVQYLIRGTVITDSYQLAVEIQQAKLPGVYQVITQDGVQLKQGMLMSNSKLGFMRNFRLNNNKQSNTNSSENILKAQKQLEDIRQKLRLLQTNSVESQLKEASSQKAQLEEQQTITLVSMKHKERSLKQLNDQNHHLQVKVGNYKDEFDQKNEQLQEIRKHLQIIQKDISNQQGKFFKEFAKKSNLKQDQIISIADCQQTIKKREASENLINKLHVSEQEMLQNCKLIDKKISELKQEIKFKTQNKDLTEKEIQLQKQRKIIEQEELDTLVEKEHELQKESKSELKKLKELIERRDKVLRKTVDTAQLMNQNKLRLDQLFIDKQKLIEECEMESINIQFKLKDEEQLDQDINYDPIKDELQIDDSSVLLEQFENKLKQKEKDATKYLSENLQVGLLGGKTDEKSNKIDHELSDLSERLSVHYDEEQEVDDLLKKAKSARAEKFNYFFKIVSDEIDSLYKTLTFQENTQLGGSAMLYLENQQDPYKGGIIYSTTPPNKKYVFDNSEQLSGGEKAIASVALQFAMNSALGTPFLLLDEIDANLDPDNTMRLRMVMQALAGKPIQFITISHNIEMFGKARSLIGVTIQHSRLTSEAFSMLLD